MQVTQNSDARKTANKTRISSPFASLPSTDKAYVSSCDQKLLEAGDVKAGRRYSLRSYFVATKNSCCTEIPTGTVINVHEMIA